VRLERNGFGLVFLRLVIGVFGTRRELCGRISQKSNGIYSLKSSLILAR
jgi:hypothetical protein